MDCCRQNFTENILKKLHEHFSRNASRSIGWIDCRLQEMFRNPEWESCRGTSEGSYRDPEPRMARGRLGDLTKMPTPENNRKAFHFFSNSVRICFTKYNKNSFLTHNHYKTRSFYGTVTSEYTSVWVFYTIHVPYLTFRAHTLSM